MKKCLLFQSFFFHFDDILNEEKNRNEQEEIFTPFHIILHLQVRHSHNSPINQHWPVSSLYFTLFLHIFTHVKKTILLQIDRKHKVKCSCLVLVLQVRNVSHKTHTLSDQSVSVGPLSLYLTVILAVTGQDLLTGNWLSGHLRGWWKN